MQKKPEIIITDIDLDGAASALVWEWIGSNSNRVIKPVRVLELSEKIINIYKNIDLEKCDVCIFDLDTSQCTDEALHIIDNNNFTIIDHHTSHVKNKDIYKKANIFIEECTSCTKLIYKKYKEQLKDLSIQQKMLIGLVDDYDSYRLKSGLSRGLNLIFWNYQGNKIEKFHKEYFEGFKNFTDKQINIINFYENKIKNITKSLELFEADIQISNHNVKIISTFASECINDVCQFIIDTHKADIAITVNLTSQKVSIRKHKDCNVPLDVFAKKIFTEGGGHHDAAGGMMCDRFATFSKTFKPLDAK